MLRQQLPAGAELLTVLQTLLKATSLKEAISAQGANLRSQLFAPPIGIVKSGHDTGVDPDSSGQKKSLMVRFGILELYWPSASDPSGDASVDKDRLRILNVVNNVPKQSNTRDNRQTNCL